jgi:hypothetical protein
MDAVLLWTASKMPQLKQGANRNELNGGDPSLNRPFPAVNGYTPRKGTSEVHRECKTYRKPPEMTSVSPVIHEESEEAKNTAAGATSSTWPMRPRGVCASICL